MSVRNKTGLLSAIAWAVSSMTAMAATNYWITAAGGTWSDTVNWQDGAIPTSSDVANLSALDSGATVTITADTSIGGIVYESGTAGTGILTGSAKLTFTVSPTVLYVGSGTFVLGTVNTLGGGGIVKTGSGTLRIDGVVTSANAIRVDAGVLLLNSLEGLTQTGVTLGSADARMRLGADAWIGTLRTYSASASSVDLNGHRLGIGGSSYGWTYDGVLSGEGGITALNGGVVALSQSPAYTEATRVKNGDLRLGSAGKAVALYRFDDIANVGADSGVNGNTLALSGTPKVVADAERGNVLSLDGSSYLHGQMQNQSITGLPSGNSAWTVAFWMKPARDIDPTAKVFSWGAINTSQIVGLRMNTAEAQKALYTNWGNNTKFGTTLMNGAWHHLAFVFDGASNVTIYVDGGSAATVGFPSANLSAANFQIGASTPWGGATFKGYIDDFFVSGEASSNARIAQLMQGAFWDNPAVSLPATGAFEAMMNGNLYLSGAQILGTLAGEGVRGGIMLDNATLTAGGNGSETSTLFRAGIGGNGSFVKCGAAYGLTLSGVSSYTGTTTVAEGTLTLRAPVTRQGLVGFYQFEDVNNLGLDSSDKGYDLASLFKNGTSGVQSVPDGVSGRAASFSVANENRLNGGWATVPSDFPYGNSPYTVSLWIKPSSSCNDYAQLFEWGTFGGRQLVFARLNGKSGVMHSNIDNNLEVPAGANLFDGAWHHLVFTYNQSAVVVYCDGRPCGTAAVSNLSIPSNDQPLMFGRGTVSSNYYDGEMDECQVYCRAWSAEEVAAEYALKRPANRSAFEALPDPVAYYSFDDATNPGKDSGPNGYNLTARGTVAVTDSPVSGKALNLTSAFGYLTAETFPESLPTGNVPVTVSCWICPQPDISVDACVAFWGDTASFMHLVGYYGTTRCLLRYTVKSGGSDCETGILAHIGVERLRWHHLVTVYDPQRRKTAIYLDGIKQSEVSDIPALNVPAANFFIGRKLSSTTAWFKGKIDEMRIYNVALTAGQIHTLTQRPSGTASAQILPATTALVINSGATNIVAGANQCVAALAGEGTLAFDGGMLRVTGPGTFNGVVTGKGGELVAEGAALTLATGAAATFQGTLAVATGGRVVDAAGGTVKAANAALVDGLVITLDPADIRLPLVDVSGALSVPANGTVQWDCGFGEVPSGTYVLAKGGSATAADGLAGWTVLPSAKSLTAKLFVKDGCLMLKTYHSGMAVLLK